MFARRLVNKLPKSSLSVRRFSSTARQANPVQWKAAALVAAGSLASYYYLRSNNPVFAASNVDPEFIATQVQPTVITGTHPQGAFVTIKLSKKANVQEVVKAAAKLPVIVGEISPDPEPNDVLLPVLAGVGFSPDILQVQKSTPVDLLDFHSRHGFYGDMPNSGGDIFLHVKGETQSLCYEIVKAFVDSLPLDSVDKVEDWYGFQYQEGRDLSGFLDGTENPAGIEERVNAAAIKVDRDSQHANGSFALHQRWIHNLKPFHGLGIEAQEAVVGRTKPDSVELSGDLALVTSHVSRMRVDREKIPIVRQSMPYGTVGGEHGLLFIAYASTPVKFDILLDRMAGSHKHHDGAHNDAIMSFSKCVASQYYYVPSSKELAAL